MFSGSSKCKKRENYFVLAYAQAFPKVLLGLSNNPPQRTNRGWGGGL